MSGGARRLRAVPGEMDREAVAAIDARLDEIRRDHRVAILLAVESGSRAWGFPSPDSDYDCRFVYVRRTRDYLSPWHKRDVIETPLEGELDVNGWDLGKALKLLLKGNAVIVEWLMSPIVYEGEAGRVEALRDFATRFVDRDGIARHYLHLGERQRRTYFGDGKEVQLKKLFYALRPATALRWLRLNPDRDIAPMHFPTLVAESEMPADVRELAEELMRRKAETREIGTAPLPKPIERFVDGEFALARDHFPARSRRISAEAREAAETLFRSALER